MLPGNMKSVTLWLQGQGKSTRHPNVGRTEVLTRSDLCLPQDCAHLCQAVPVCSLFSPALWRGPADQVRATLCTLVSPGPAGSLRLMGRQRAIFYHSPGTCSSGSYSPGAIGSGETLCRLAEMFLSLPQICS